MNSSIVRVRKSTIHNADLKKGGQKEKAGFALKVKKKKKIAAHF